MGLGSLNIVSLAKAREIASECHLQLLKAIAPIEERKRIKQTALLKQAKAMTFEEVAEQKAAGKILQALVQIGVPAGAGAKIATKLATKALQAKKAGTYVNLKGKNVRKGMEKVYKLNDASRAKRFAAGVVGGGAGEVFVADQSLIHI